MIHLLSLTIGLFLFSLAYGETGELPQLGHPSNTYLTPSQETQLAEKYLTEIVNSGQLYQDPLAEEYLQQLGNRLVAALPTSGDHFHFFLINSPTVNAFAGPGGLIMIHTGLIINVNSEDELAAVLAHELSHVTQGHLARQLSHLKHMRLPTAAGILAAIALGSQVPQMGTAALAATYSGIEQHLLKFSREHEREADRMGMELLQKANFDPRGMIHFLENIQQHELDTQEISEYLNTHPLTGNRIADVTERANEYPITQKKVHPDFALIKARLMVTTTTDPLDLLTYFQAMQKSNDLANQYGLGLAYIRTKQYAKAQSIFATLNRLYPNNGLLQLAYGDSSAAMGDWQQAESILEKAHLIHGDNYPIMLAFARTLIEVHREQQAIDLLEQYILRHPQGKKPYSTLAMAQARAGFKANAYETRAKYFLSQGDNQKAIQQLKTAKNLPDISPISKKQIESKIDVLVSDQS